ncbi:unnamed protein product [Rotaria sordida]|uniref:Gliding motility-associated C-terminal domain-containing protein n=1 Tax=Rotaria sordida TaxID=392033 RepID=A0A813PGF3_9BILA|nr:unnamed protein product [Rotaria sordida]
MLFISSLVFSARLFAQCPQNIGFESGTFANWECFSGTINSGGFISVNPTAPTADRHVILQNSVPQQKDFYGGFPVNCPNGSKYSIRLGNANTGAQAERVSYTFTIPAWQTDFSIIYNYAVVFQNPNHAAIQQPRFTAKVFDVTAGDYVGCGSFEFVASGNLPGFQVSPVKSDVFYKPWSPITIKLLGYSGKTIRLEFTNNDCTPGGHFGYAYIDVNENCASPISGNTYCAGTTDSMTLVAPFGFQEYHWYTSDFSTLLGTGNTLTLTPPPPPGTVYALEIVPYPGLGCLDTLRSTIQYSGSPFNLHVKDTIKSCSSDGIDLTSPTVTAGSTAGLDFSYFTDLSQQNYLATPTYVNTPGTYYIKGTNAEGCNGIKPVTAVFFTPPNFVLQGNPLACTPQKVDITNPTYTTGSDPTLTYSYWMNPEATVPLPNPTAIDVSGPYFVKATDVSGCSIIKSINANVSATPSLTTNDQAACGKVNIANASVIDVTPGSIISFWTDNAATSSLQIPESISTSGTYFIKASNVDGCEIIKPINATVKPIPNFTFSNPLPIKFPATFNLGSLVAPVAGTVYSYWLDPAATKILQHYTAIDTTATYYIKATNTDGCSSINPVKVVVGEPDIVASNAISPNGDGVNDTWEIPLLSRRYPYCTVEIFNRYGQVLFSSTGYRKPWDGRVNGKPLPNGTYYYIINRGNLYPPISGNISVVY